MKLGFSLARLWWLSSETDAMTCGLSLRSSSAHASPVPGPRYPAPGTQHATQPRGVGRRLSRLTWGSGASSGGAVTAGQNVRVRLSGQGRGTGTAFHRPEAPGPSLSGRLLQQHGAARCWTQPRAPTPVTCDLGKRGRACAERPPVASPPHCSLSSAPCLNPAPSRVAGKRASCSVCGRPAFDAVCVCPTN